jgi:hypothetical protein
MNDDLVYRLRKRAEIRRQIPSRKSVLEGAPDRIADLLEEAAGALEKTTCQENRHVADNATTEWVGLTDEDFAVMVHIQLGDGSIFDSKVFAKNIEAMLKEKNT